MPLDSQGHEPQKVVKGSRHKRLLSEAIQLEEEVVPQFVKPALYAIAILIGAFVAWASVVEINEVASAPGEVVPSGSIKVVEHLDGGAVKEILVEEGELVEEGQPLVRMDGADAQAELQQMQARFVALRLRGERLVAFAEDRQPQLDEIGAGYPELIEDQKKIFQNQLEARESSRSIIESQIQQRRRELVQMRDALKIARQQQKVTGEMVTMRKVMADQKLIPKMEFLETQRAKITSDGEVARLLEQIEVTQQTVTESERRLKDLDQQLRREALAEMGTVSAQIAEVRNAIKRLESTVDRLEVHAPTSGLVQELQVQTVGQVVQPGALLMRIVPINETLEAEVRISTGDIGHVAVDQPVLVKVASYDYSRFGGVQGTLRKISASSIVEEGKDPYFRAWVRLERPYVGTQPGRFMVAPGMTVQADVTTGRKTLLAYLIKPLSDALDRAFEER